MENILNKPYFNDEAMAFAELECIVWPKLGTITKTKPVAETTKL